MKTLNDIKNVEVENEIEKLSQSFPTSHIDFNIRRPSPFDDCHTNLVEREFVAISYLFDKDLMDSFGSEYNVPLPKHKWERWDIHTINLSFDISNIETSLEVKAKVLERFSKACSIKVYANEKINPFIRAYIRKCCNAYLGTQFSEEDWSDIYYALGDGVHRDKVIRFILSDYDMNILSARTDEPTRKEIEDFFNGK